MMKTFHTTTAYISVDRRQDETGDYVSLFLSERNLRTGSLDGERYARTYIEAADIPAFIEALMRPEDVQTASDLFPLATAEAAKVAERIADSLDAAIDEAFGLPIPRAFSERFDFSKGQYVADWMKNDNVPMEAEAFFDQTERESDDDYSFDPTMEAPLLTDADAPDERITTPTSDFGIGYDVGWEDGNAAGYSDGREDGRPVSCLDCILDAASGVTTEDSDHIPPHGERS